MPGATPIYGFPYQLGTDSPAGDDMSEDLANAVETELAAVDAAKLPLANYAAVSLSITPVSGVATSGTVSWGKTLPSTPIVVATAVTGAPGVVIEVSVSAISTTGCTVWIFRNSTSATTINVIAICP